MRSAAIPQGDRNPNGYTEEEILHELRGLRGTREVSFRYEHLDSDFNHIKNLDNVISGSVQLEYTSAIKRTASFTFYGDNGVDFLLDYIKPWYRLKMPPQLSTPKYDVNAAWSNSFAGASADIDVTSQNSGFLGSAFGTVSGTTGQITYSRVHRIGSDTSVKMLGGTASTLGAVTTQVSTTAEEKLVRTWVYVDDGGEARVSVLRSDGTTTVIAVDVNHNDTGNIRIDGVDYAVAADAFDTWTRIDILLNPTELTYDVSLYWTLPTDYTATPDLSSSGDLVSGDDLGFVSVESPTSAEDIYWGPLHAGDAVYYPAVPTETENDWVEWSMGVFMMSTPTRVADENQVVTREVEAYDLSKLFIDDKLTERFAVTKGTKYTDIMVELLGDHPHIVEPSTYVVGRNREWDVGTEIKEVLDAIAESINYHTMQVDEDGTVIYRPYVSPKDRTPEFDYSDNEISIMHPDVSAEFDIYEIANVWIVSLSEVDQDPVYVKLENHDPANPFSIPRRGRRIVDFRDQEEGFDPTSLSRKARRIQFEANRQYENIEFSTLSNPLHATNDCYTINFSSLNISNKYTETGWAFEMSAGEKMTHSARRDVYLDPELFDGFVEDHLEVTGSLTAGNIDWGTTSVTPVANKPTSFTVTGLNLVGSGPVCVQVTPVSTNPGTIKGCSVSDEKPTSFKVWVFRTNTTVTDVNWIAMRDI